MYSINVDKMNRIIYLLFSGHVDYEEINAYIFDLVGTISQFDKDVSVVVLMERLDPIAQEYIPVYIEGLCIVSEYIKKIAFVHKRVITRMQFKRILDTVNSKCTAKMVSRICLTKEEAISFIKES